VREPPGERDQNKCDAEPDQSRGRCAANPTVRCGQRRHAQPARNARGEKDSARRVTQGHQHSQPRASCPEREPQIETARSHEPQRW